MRRQIMRIVGLAAAIAALGQQAARAEFKIPGATMGVVQPPDVPSAPMNTPVLPPNFDANVPHLSNVGRPPPPPGGFAPAPMPPPAGPDQTIAALCAALTPEARQRATCCFVPAGTPCQWQ